MAVQEMRQWLTSENAGAASKGQEDESEEPVLELAPVSRSLPLSEDITNPVSQTLTPDVSSLGPRPLRPTVCLSVSSQSRFMELLDVLLPHGSGAHGDKALFMKTF